MFLPAEEKALLKAAKSKKHQKRNRKPQASPTGEDNAATKDNQSLFSNLNQINAFATSNPFGGQNGNGEAKPKAYHARQTQGPNAGKKHQNQERVGDWTCQRCFNHNYAFRDVCNMCYLSHIESNKMLYNQQQNRLETVQSGHQQPYYQNQYQSPMQQFQQPGSPQAHLGGNNNMMPEPAQEEPQPRLSLLSQSAKPFIPTYLQNACNKKQSFGNNNNYDNDYPDL